MFETVKELLPGVVICLLIAYAQCFASVMCLEHHPFKLLSIRILKTMINLFHGGSVHRWSCLIQEGGLVYGSYNFPLFRFFFWSISSCPTSTLTMRTSLDLPSEYLLSSKGHERLGTVKSSWITQLMGKIGSRSLLGSTECWLSRNFWTGFLMQRQCLVIRLSFLGGNEIERLEAGTSSG